MTDDIDKSIRAALGFEEEDDGDALTSPEDQMDFLVQNTDRVSREEIIDVYRIAYTSGCSEFFRPKEGGFMTVFLNKMPHDIIRRMYLQLKIFIDKKRA